MNKISNRLILFEGIPGSGKGAVLLAESMLEKGLLKERSNF